MAAAEPPPSCRCEPEKRPKVFQAPKYVQQQGALAHLAEFVASPFPGASRPALVTSQRLRSRYGGVLADALPGAAVATFSGECTRAAIERLVAELRLHASPASSPPFDYLVGFGGGKLLDAAKLVAAALGVPSVMVPSLASTDAPCIAMSVVYSAGGEFEAFEFFPRPPDLVVVDSQVIAEAPPEFLVAGMGDAMATFYEARACGRNPKAYTWLQPLAYRPPRIAHAIGQECANILFAHGLAAKADCEAGRVTEALEQVIEANILLSGLGVECGGLAIAHGLHNALTLLPETHSLMHGQKVAFGTIVQLVAEGDEAEAKRVAAFNKAVGLPATLKDLHIELDDAKLGLLVDACLTPDNICWNFGPALSAELLRSSIVAADKLGAAA